MKESKLPAQHKIVLVVEAQSGFGAQCLAACFAFLLKCSLQGPHMKIFLLAQQLSQNCTEKCLLIYISPAGGGGAGEGSIFKVLQRDKILSKPHPFHKRCSVRL